MKKILFPTDFSKAAENAFIYALRMAKQTGAEIITFHSFQLPSLQRTHLPITVQEVYDSINLEHFENYKDSVPHLHKIAEEQGLGGVKVYHTMEEGDPIASISRMAKKEGADLIVMGTTGASGLKEALIGSVAAEVMENAPCPVLAVPMDAKFDGKLDRIGMTTEFKREEILALKWLNKWAKPFEADIYCVHADLNHVESFAHRMDELKAEFLTERNIRFEVIDATDMETAIAGYLSEYRIDLLAMVIHRRNFFQELFSYSQTKKMAYHLKTPVLALPANLFSEGRTKLKLPVIGTV